MKIGVRAHDFGRLSVMELPKIISQAGFQSVQLAITKAIIGITDYSHITDNVVHEIRTEFERNNLEISVLGCYIEPSILDKSQRINNVNIFNQCIKHAKNLGAKVVGTETTEFGNIHESQREVYYSNLVDSVLRMVENAEKENIFIGIEPVATHVLNTPQLTKRLIDDINSDKLRIIFDPVNLLSIGTIDQQNRIYSECFELFGDKIIAFHAKDIIIENNQIVWKNIGKGLVDYNFIFNKIKDINKDISILREGIELDNYNDDIVALKSLIEK